MSEHKTYLEPIQLLDAENEPIEGSSLETVITNVTDGIQIKIAGSVFVVERVESEHPLTRLFVIGDDGDDETIVVEIYGKDGESDDPRQIKVFTTGGKVIFDSEEDNRYARD